MALKLSSANGSYLWPVSVDFPVDGGGTDTLLFDAKFKRLPQSKTEELVLIAIRNAQSLQVGKDPDPNASDRAIAAEVVVGWQGIKDDNDEEVPFSQSNLNALLEFPGAAGAIAKAWFESINGKKAKN
jgi:hypothetical protein